MTKIKLAVLMLSVLGLGVILGGYLFSDTRPRSFLALNRCEGTCLQANELLGLATSVGLQRFSALAPAVVKETDKTIVLDFPGPHAGVHYLLVPKKDLRNIADVSNADREYLLDTLKVAGEIIREKSLTNYVLATNGPGYQGVTYLHFHLTAN